MKDTGHGATVTFGSTGFTAQIRKIGAVDHEGEKVEDTTLDVDTFKTYLAGDLLEPGEFTLDIAFDAEAAQPTPLAPETVTITFPTATGQTTPATLAGSAFIRKFPASPEMGTNQLQEGQIVVAYDGKTGPTFTVAS